MKHLKIQEVRKNVYRKRPFLNWAELFLIFLAVISLIALFIARGL